MINWTLAGFPKCGTTWLAKHLNNHPDLTIQKGGAYEEVQYFATRNLYDKGRSWYESQFPESDGRKVGDYSARYVQKEYCLFSSHNLNPPKLIHRNLGPIPIIVCVRDPVERMESQINHWVDNGVFPEGITMGELWSKKEWCLRKMLLINMGRYWHGVNHFLELNPDWDIYVWVLEEDTVQHPMMSLQNLFTWLGVDPQKYPNGKDLEKPENQRNHHWTMPEEWRERVAELYETDAEELFLWMGKPIPDSWCI